MSSPATLDPEEAEMLRGAALALRRRADRQAKLVKDGTALGENGSPIRTGEAAIAVRVSLTLARLAAEFEREWSTAVARAA